MSTLQLFAPAWMSKAKGSVELLELMGDKKKREEAQAFWKNLVAEGNRINELIQVQGQADKIPGLLREAGLDREAAGRELAEALGSARSILQKSNDKATQLMDAMAIRETALKESEAGLSGNQAAHLEAVRLADEKMVAAEAGVAERERLATSRALEGTALKDRYEALLGAQKAAAAAA